MTEVFLIAWVVACLLYSIWCVQFVIRENQQMKLDDEAYKVAARELVRKMGMGGMRVRK